jgi:hypothetical protein
MGHWTEEAPGQVNRLMIEFLHQNEVEKSDMPGGPERATPRAAHPTGPPYR